MNEPTALEAKLLQELDEAETVAAQRRLESNMLRTQLQRKKEKITKYERVCGDAYIDVDYAEDVIRISMMIKPRSFLTFRDTDKAIDNLARKMVLQLRQELTNHDTRRNRR